MNQQSVYLKVFRYRENHQLNVDLDLWLENIGEEKSLQFIFGLFTAIFQLKTHQHLKKHQCFTELQCHTSIYSILIHPNILTRYAKNCYFHIFAKRSGPVVLYDASYKYQNIYSKTHFHFKDLQKLRSFILEILIPSLPSTYFLEGPLQHITKKCRCISCTDEFETCVSPKKISKSEFL